MGMPPPTANLPHMTSPFNSPLLIFLALVVCTNNAVLECVLQLR